MGVCGDDKRKAGVVRNDLRDAKIGFGPARKKSPRASNSPSSVTLYLQTPSRKHSHEAFTRSCIPFKFVGTFTIFIQSTRQMHYEAIC